MKKLIIILALIGCEGLTDSPAERAQKTINACQPYRATITQLEDKIFLLESKIEYLQEEISSLESSQY